MLNSCRTQCQEKRVLCIVHCHFPHIWTWKSITPGQWETKEENQDMGLCEVFQGWSWVFCNLPVAWRPSLSALMLKYLSDCVSFLFINLISSLECVLVCLDGVEYSFFWLPESSRRTLFLWDSILCLFALGRGSLIKESSHLGAEDPLVPLPTRTRLLLRLQAVYGLSRIV